MTFPYQPAPQGYPQQPYPQQPQPQYPPQGYGQGGYPPPPQMPQQAPAPQQPPAPQGSLSDFFSQPSAGNGPALKFKDKPKGTSYTGIVARAVTNADVRAQTDPNGRPTTYRDGRPKFVMVVPLQVEPTQEFPEGRATWWVKGQARDELVRAMAEAGAPEGPPEAGAAVRVTLVGERPVPGMNPALQYRVEYVRPQGADQQPAQQPTTGGQFADEASQDPPQEPPQAPVQAVPAQPAQPAQPQAPEGLSEDKQELLRKLTG